jgi:hypothetical protein
MRVEDDPFKGIAIAIKGLEGARLYYPIPLAPHQREIYNINVDKRLPFPEAHKDRVIELFDEAKTVAASMAFEKQRPQALGEVLIKHTAMYEKVTVKGLEDEMGGRIDYLWRLVERQEREEACMWENFSEL